MTAVLLWFGLQRMPADDAIWVRLLGRARAHSGLDGFDMAAGEHRLWVGSRDTGTPDGVASGCAARSGSERSRETSSGLVDGVGAKGNDVSTLFAVASRALAPATLSFDPQRWSLRAHRHPMGYRQLAWARVPGGVLLATNEALLLGHPAVDRRHDPAGLAAYAAGISPAHDETIWQGIRLLGAGETRTWHASHDEVVHERLEPADTWHGLGEAGRAARLKDLLDDAVLRATDGARRIGVSLSAGLDSGALAACLANGGRRTAAKPLCVTYGFDRWPAIDERAAAGRLAGHLGFEHIGLAVDDLRPLRRNLRRPVCPDTPLQTPWREFKEASYVAFAAAGVNTVVSGNFGDHLWAHPKHWLAEALRDRALRPAWSGLRGVLWRDGVRGLLQDPGLRALARPWRLRHPVPPGRLAMLAPPWRERLMDRLRDELAALRHWPRPEQAHLVLNAWASFDACGEDWYAARHGLRVVQPYRDIELTRAMLTLPAWDSQRGPVSKWLLREAMRGRLPAECITRDKVGDLTPYAEAADRREADEIRRLAAIAAPVVEPLLAPDVLRWTTPGDHDWMLASLGLWIEKVASL
jgi:asparagine synthase (glutamine-hydrolysing)